MTELFRLDSLYPAFIFLCLFVMPMFFSRDRCDYLFLFLGLFLSLAPISILKNSKKDKILNTNCMLKFSSRSFEIANSPLFLIIVFYAILISIRTCVVDGYSIDSIHENILLELMPLIIYLILINRLIVDLEGFLYIFISVLIFSASMNSLFNIMYYFQLVNIQYYFSIIDNNNLFYVFNNLTEIFKVRLGVESIGVATGNTATHFGLVYAIFCMAAIIIFDRSKLIFIKIFYFYFIFLLFVALILTQSRGSILAFYVSATLYLISRGVGNFTKKHIPIFLVALLMGALSFLMLWQSGRFLHDGYRYGVWQQSIGLLMERPFLGYGERDFFQPILVAPGETLFHGHNMLINAGLRGGILALISMVVFFIIGLYKAYLLNKKFNNPIPFFLLLTLVISGFFDFDVVVRGKGWEWIAIWTVIALVVGSDSSLKYKKHTCLGLM